MRKLVFVAICLLVLAAAATAQKIDTRWSCMKPTENPMLEVGDAPAHQYGLAKGTCKAASSGSGEKSGAYAEVQEMWKESVKVHGHFIVTMDNGDTVHYTYEGTGSPDPKKPMANKWKIESGTGKHKGMKGAGSCSGKQNADGSSDWTCTGTYSMGSKS